ncbi:MAG: AAA family ATPase [Patescibacteria group bacterium]|nr:AAA family ATPase [Patescibacteria group bacterium]
MNWSTEQQAVIDWFKSGNGNLVVNACAGTGKTTTIKGAFEHAPESHILYAVFNKRNQKEAEEKIKDPRVEVRTLHSLGYRYVKTVWSSAKPDGDVEFDRAEKALFGTQFQTNKEIIAACVKLSGFLKNTFIAPTQNDAYQKADELELITGERVWDEKLVCASLRILELSRVRDPQCRISFDDMVWLPVAMNWVKPWYDLVCVDECQDMNTPQLSMARQACKKGGRIVVVGDRRQAIYGFRGAANNAIGMMKQVLRAEELPLNVTFRCPRSVVALARSVVPDYQAAEQNPDGLVGKASEEKMKELCNPGQTAILSRLNAPLMPIALSFLRKNIPARIEGRDIGKQLITMVKSFKATSIELLLTKIEDWRKKQCERLEKTRNAEKRIEQTNDIALTLSELGRECDTVSSVETKLNNLFQDTDSTSKPAVVLSTVHKAKGLEWPQVFLLSETFRNGKGIQEEDNIWYVAVTRSKKELYFVGQRKTTLETSKPPINDSGAIATAPSEPVKVEIPAVSAESNLQVTNLPPDSYRLPAGLRYHEVGNVIRYEKAKWICSKVSESSAVFVPYGTTGEKVQIKNRITGEVEREFTARASGTLRICATYENGFVIDVDKDFLLRGSRRNSETNNETNGDESETMKKETKKTAPKKTNGEKKEGKIAFIERHLLMRGGERKTKTEIVELVLKQFPSSNEKTIRNTVQWCASYDLPKKGKTSNHLPEERASSEKPVKTSKAPAKGKVSAPAKKSQSKAIAKPLAPAPKRVAPKLPAAPPSPEETPAEETQSEVATEEVAA